MAQQYRTTSSAPRSVHPFGQFHYPTSPEQVSLKRKQQAIRSLGPLTTDAAGNPAPFASPTAYEQASVAVPFGNCTELSNITAGGGACPIRGSSRDTGKTSNGMILFL